MTQPTTPGLRTPPEKKSTGSERAGRTSQRSRHSVYWMLAPTRARMRTPKKILQHKRVLNPTLKAGAPFAAANEDDMDTNSTRKGGIEAFSYNTAMGSPGKSVWAKKEMGAGTEWGPEVTKKAGRAPRVSPSFLRVKNPERRSATGRKISPPLPPPLKKKEQRCSGDNQIHGRISAAKRRGANAETGGGPLVGQWARGARERLTIAGTRARKGTGAMAGNLSFCARLPEINAMAGTERMPALSQPSLGDAGRGSPLPE